MRNRFKPNLNNSRAGLNSTSLSNKSSESTSDLTANLESQNSLPNDGEEGSSTERTVTAEGDHDNLVTPTPSSAPASARLRRSRIKPTVVPVARTRAKAVKNRPQQDSEDGKETGLSDAQECTVSGKEDQHLDDDLQGSEECKSTVETSRCSSLKERNQENNVPCVPSLPVKDTDQLSQAGVQEPIKKQSPSVNDKTNSENVTTLASGSVGPPSLLRRKRVLPNLGSASRRRHSSVSKENVERTFDVPEVHNEEVISAENELSDGMPFDSSGNRSKEPLSLSQGEKSTEAFLPPTCTVVSDINSSKVDGVQEEEDIAVKRKGVKRKRGGRSHKPKEPTDPSQMTMEHLIYYNPKTNPMMSNLTGKRKKVGRSKNDIGNEDEEEQDVSMGNGNSSVSGSPTSVTQPTDNKETSNAEDDADDSAVAPRVKLDADGNIILDEESLLIPKETDKVVESSEVVYEDADQVTYGTYLKRGKVRRWSLEETQTFYKALSQVGTDFGLMLPLFPCRKRRELKAKFKKEEKVHRDLVEKALCVRNPIEVELFTPKVEGEEIDDDLETTDNISAAQQGDSSTQQNDLGIGET